MSIFDPVIDVVKTGQRFLVASHAHPDGDGIGSTIALAMGLRTFGKDVVMFNADRVPHNLGFLPEVDNVVNSLENEAPFDVTFMVDCSQRERIGGDVAKMPREKLGRIVLIDHHRIDSPDCDLMCIDADAAATGEVIYRFFKKVGIPITKEIATLLFTTFVVDTGSFRYSNTSSALMQAAGELIGSGASPWMINMALEESRPPCMIPLLRRVLETFEVDSRVAWITLTSQMLHETCATVDVAEEFINYPRSILGVEVAILFRELRAGKWKISFRSKDKIDVYKIAATFGGGGHSHAAGCTLEGNLAGVKSKILGEVRRVLGE